MKAENAKKQAKLMLNLIKEITKASNELNELYELDRKGETSINSVEYFQKEYRQTYDSLFHILEVATNRYYELDKMSNY